MDDPDVAAPSLKNLYTRLLAQESKIKERNQNRDRNGIRKDEYLKDKSGNRSLNNGNYDKGLKKTCTACGRLGHEEASYYWAHPELRPKKNDDK